MGVNRKHQSITESKSHVKAMNAEVEVSCQRVTRIDGHQIFASIQLEQPTTLEEVLECLNNWRPPEHLRKCPSAPYKSLHIVEHIDVEQHLWSNGLEQSHPARLQFITRVRVGLKLQSLSLIHISSPRDS